MQKAAPWILAVLAGVTLALAMPGPGLWPLVLLFPGLLLEAIERSESRWKPWLLGLVAGTVHWVVATNWVFGVMHHYGGLPVVAAIGSVVGMGAILSITWAVVVGLSARVSGPWRLWIFPVLWVAVDSLRRFQPFQFPWNDVAAVFGYLPAMLGSLPVWGASGLGWAAVAVGAGIWGVVRRDRRPAAVALLVAAIGLTLVFANLAPSPIPSGPTIRMAVLQPGTSLEEKWDPGEWQEIADRVWELTRKAADAGADVVLWPESAVPFRIDNDPVYRDIVTDLSSGLGIQIVLNSVGETTGGGSTNSAYLVTENGVAPVRYDKVHLVPFGEYVPGWADLIISDALVREVGRFTPGRSAVGLPAVVPLGVSICYEVVFGDHAASQVLAGSQALVTLTNDGWYGFSWAPVQHFAQVRLRAVENRRWFARAALTGISGFVDPYGRVASHLEIGELGLLVADIHPSTDLTPRVRWGDWWAVLCAVAAAALFFAPRARSRDRRDR
jgi:apolipoprotein N-acyltransferase